jgi:hypothetical protein
MAAGLGFKTFTTGEVLTAADTNGYLMQGILVFASAAARDAAITSPQEGQFAYLKDTNVTTYYTGSAWANVDTTGMTNPMTTTGDTIYSSSGSTPARLGIGTAGQVLQVNSGATAPEWATPAGGGGMTLINSGGTTLTGSSVLISSIPATYKNLELVIRNYLPATDDREIRIRINDDSNANRHYFNETLRVDASYNATSIFASAGVDNAVTQGLFYYNFFDYANTTTWKLLKVYSLGNRFDTTTNLGYLESFGAYNQTDAISSLRLFPSSGNFTSGTAYLYGVS